MHESRDENNFGQPATRRPLIHGYDEKREKELGDLVEVKSTEVKVKDEKPTCTYGAFV